MPPLSEEQRAANTKIALIEAFEGVGLPRNVFPDLDQQTLADYIGELAVMSYYNSLPRQLRRTNGDLLLDAFVRALGRAFWAGAAYVVKRDAE